jgi:hypothetical protein
MCLKLKEEVEIPPTLINLINDDFGVVFELSLLTFYSKNEVLGEWKSLLSF